MIAFFRQYVLHLSSGDVLHVQVEIAGVWHE